MSLHKQKSESFTIQSGSAINRNNTEDKSLIMKSSWD